MLTKKDILLLLCGGGGFLRSLPLFQDLGLDPGHGGIAGQLSGDQGLDLDAHFGEHALVLGADVPLRLVLVQVKGLPGDLVAGSGEILQAVAEQVVVISLEVDLAAVLEEFAVLDELAGIGEPVLVGGSVLAPRVAEVDIDAADGILGGEHALDALDVGAHDLHVVDGAACGGVGRFDLPLGEDEHLIGDVDAQIVVLRVGAGQLGDEAALAAENKESRRVAQANHNVLPFNILMFT